ncbi:hypothetical protein COCON_G00191640 [Conger conger]|uniref:Synaptotagmin-like protein 2 n=1 Tax=Conger conger TaxID=82655 RepID=A0A9Q1HSC6_CONCO|nr:hypothetical protein COCON_G00191640 [Conger conger]
MIDLSYLTEEEQEMIMTVLQRDAKLKKAEGDRVKQLQRLPKARGKIKYMTGEWFYEAKSQRHMDRIHGSDIIRASMKQKNPMSLFNFTQSWKARTRAVSNGNQEILSTPEPLQLYEEPPMQPEEERESDSASPDPQQETPRPAVRSLSKRHNPFNRASLLLSENPGETDRQRTNGALGPHETTAGESLSPLKSDVAGLTDDLSSEGHGAFQEIDTKPAPIPKKRTILFRPLDHLHDNDSPFRRWGDRRSSRNRLVTPQGILKDNTSWSSTDSGLPYEGAGRRLELSGDHLSWSSAVAPEGEPPEEGAEDKGLSSPFIEQEKFRLKDTAKGPELEDGREFGNRDLLDLDHPMPLDEERREVEPATGRKKDDSSKDLSLALCMTGCDQPSEEEGCSSDVSATLKDCPRPLPLSSESKFGWMAHTKFPPYLRMPPPVSEPDLNRSTGGMAEEGTGEERAEGEVAAMRREEVCVRSPVGKYETQADSTPPQVSYLPSPKDEKGKPVYGGIGSLKSPPVLEVQSPEFIEDDSIAKVLEWFSRSIDGIDHQEEDVHQQGADIDYAGPKDEFTSTNQMTEYTLVSGGSPTAEMQVSHPRRAQLERSARVEGMDIVCVEDTNKTQSPIEQEETCPESAEEDPIILQHSSLNIHSAYQRNLRMSTVDTKPQSQKKENFIDTKEEHDGEAKAILLSPVTKATQQEVEQSVARNDRLPQRVANMKSFWEKGNSGPKILTSRPSITAKQKEPVSETDRTKTESEVGKVGQDILPRPEETCLDTEAEKEAYGTCLSHSHSHDLAQCIHNTGNSLDMEDIVIEPSVLSVLPIAHEYPLERAGNHHREPELVLAPVCADKPQALESSHLVKSLDEEEKYIAKCIVIDEDMEIPISSVEEKTDLHMFPQKEEVPHGVTPLSSQVSPLVKQSSPAPTVKQTPNQLENSADKIRHLKHFWESEKRSPKIITGETPNNQPKQEISGTTESQLPASPACTNNNSTKSEFDLGMLATENNSSASLLKEGPNFTVISMKQRMEKASMGQSTSNFKNLCHFWDGTPSTERTTLSPKSPQLKGQEPRLNALEKSLSPTGNKTPYLNPNYYPKLPSKDLEVSNFRVQRSEKYNLKTYSIDISSPKSEEKKPFSPTPLPRQASGSSDEIDTTRSSEIGPSTEINLSQQRPAGQEQQNPPPASDQAPLITDRASMTQRDPEPPRTPSLGQTSGTVNLSEEQQDVSSEQLRNRQEELPGESHRETPEGTPSGPPNVVGRPKPLARSIVPYDYHHYLGIPEGGTFQSMPATKKEEEEVSACFRPELELSEGSGPVRSSTPVVPEEPQARRGSDGQYPWHSHYGTDDVDRDSCRSSNCETWSYSGTSSVCDEDVKSVRKALERAKHRPVSSCKSVEDISLLATREEEDRSKNTSRTELMLSMDDASVIPPSPPSFTSDPAQMKNMSKSVPSFLLKESNGRDSDSTSESSVHTGRQTKMGSSLTNLSSCSGMSSVSGSAMSIYSGDFGHVEVRGTILFSMNYMQKLKELHVFVVQCRDLAAVDTEKNRSNPYVKSYLLPGQAQYGKRKTSVKKKTLNPNFNEILRYRVRLETLKTQMLNLSVWHNDTFGRNSFLGEVEVDLSKWDFGNTKMNNLTLKPRVQSGFQASDFRGEMRLALRFLPEMSYSNKSKTGEVHIWVKDCKDLPITRGTSVNPFVRCFVLPDTSRKSRQKTRILKKTQNPAFNHTMVYDGFKAEDLPEACVELTVWDYDHIASHLVGGLRLGLGTGKSYGEVVGWMDSNADEANLWERMMDSPNEWVDDVLPLRMMTIAKNLWK